MHGILRAAGLWQRAHLHINTEVAWYFKGCWSLAKGSFTQKYRVQKLVNGSFAWQYREFRKWLKFRIWLRAHLHGNTI